MKRFTCAQAQPGSLPDPAYDDARDAPERAPGLYAIGHSGANESPVTLAYRDFGIGLDSGFENRTNVADTGLLLEV